MRRRLTVVLLLAVVGAALLAFLHFQAKKSGANDGGEVDVARDEDPVVNRHDENIRREVLRGYRRLAHYSYEASYHAVARLKQKINALLQNPSAATLAAARASWRLAHRDYSQTEVFRFGNWIVDDWEGTVNAWPVDEGVLDYVAASYQASPTNPLARHNLVASPEITVGGLTINTERLDWTQLKFIHGGSDVESNVLLGFHAIEFLLWGQDLSGANPGAGQRPWSDYSLVNCSSGMQAAPQLHCQRRRKLLSATVEYLYTQLGGMTLNWAGNSPVSYGLHIAEGDINEGLRRMLFGMIRLGGDELPGERMQVALLTGAPEEEQDCFSDDTHQSAYFNAVGIVNIYYGRYRNDGYKNGESYQAEWSLAKVAQQRAPALAAEIDGAFEQSKAALQRIRQLGEKGETFDLLIQPGNELGEAVVQQAIDSLQQQSALLEKLGSQLGLGSLNPQAPVDSSPRH